VADISITLTLDDSQYTGKIREVSALTQATSSQMTQSLEKVNASLLMLNTNLSKLTDGMNRVKAAGEGAGTGLGSMTSQLTKLSGLIAAGSLTGLTEQIMKSSNEIHNLGEGLGIGTESMLELSAAAIPLGRDINQTGLMLERMLNVADQAEEGNQKLRNAFEKVGISMSDLNKMSPDETFKKIAVSLAAMTDPAERARVAQELLGRAAMGIDWIQYVANLHQTEGALTQHSQSVDDASRAYNQLQTGLNQLRLNLADLLDPIFKIIGNNAAGLLGMKSAAEGVLAVLTVMAGGAIITGLIAVGTALTPIIAGLLEVAAIVVPIIALIGGVGATIDRVFKTHIMDTAGEMWDGLKQKIEGATHALEGYDKAGQSSAEFAARDPRRLDLNKPATSSTKPVDLEAPRVQAMQAQLAILNQDIALRTARLAVEMNTANLGEVERQRALTAFDESARQARQLLELDKQIATLRSESSKPNAVSRAPEIALLEKEKQTIIDTNKAQADLKAGAIEVAQAKKEQFFWDNQIRETNLKIADITDQIAQLTMSASERKIAAYNKEKETRIKAAEEEYVKITQLELSETKRVEIREKITDEIKKEQAAQEELNKTANTFDVGFTQAWHKFADNAGTAADQGKAAFDGFTSAVDKAIDAMTSRSKVSFKSMVDSFIMSLVNSQLKSAFASLMNSAGGASNFSLGGAFSALGMGNLAASLGLNTGNVNLGSVTGEDLGLFYANGGNIPAGGIGIVGESGPEIVSGPATVTSARDTAQMLNDNSGGGTTIHNYNISAVDAKSVAQLFYENRMTMYGMTEQARRELPMRNR